MAHQMLGLRWTIDRRRLARGGRATACLALAFPALVVLCAFLVAGPAWWLVALVAGLLALSLVRPGWGWLALIAISPFGDLLGRSAGFLFGLTEPLVLAFLAGWLVREALRAPRDGEPALPTTSRLPLALAGLFGLAVVASMTVHLIVVQVSSAFPLDFARYVWRFVWHDYYRSVETLRVIRGAAFMLEGVGLFVASVVLLARDQHSASTAVRVFVAGAAAVAAANLGRLVYQVLAGTTPFTLAGVLTERIGWVFPDVNAAGSYFVMALFAAGGLVASSRGAVRSTSLVAAILLVLGLWVSGSRTAFVAGALVTGCMGVAFAARRGWARMLLVLPLLLVLAAVTVSFVLVSPRSNQGDYRIALRSRAEMAYSALRMVSNNPVFGIGPGLFWESSREHIRPEWRETMPRENAHNNFLQVVAELGTVGLATLIALLGVIAVAFYRCVVGRVAGWVPGLAAGLFAFVTTWMAGHPLLTREVATAFWLAVGMAVALSARERHVARAAFPKGRTDLVVAALLIAALVPTVAAYRLARADLSRAGRGFSQWHVEPDGTRFRWMARQSVLYVPASAKAAVLRLRSPGGAATVRVMQGGRTLGQVVTDSAEWRELQIEVPPNYRSAFVPVTLAVRSSLPAGQGEPRSGGEVRVQVALPRIIR